MNSLPVLVSYSAVHQAYQIALAAQEAGLLDTFYGSIIDAPGKWGRKLNQIFGNDALHNRRCDGLPPDRCVEYPWPELLASAKRLAGYARRDEWIWVARQFDRHTSKLISNKDCRLLVGVENCAAESFKVGRSKGMKLVYDCPGFNPDVSDQTAQCAADKLKLPRPEPSDAAEVKASKEQELVLADCVLVYSEVHQRSWEQRGVAPHKFVRIPLSIDLRLWFPHMEARHDQGPLRVLFAGGGTLMKGLPYLLEAVSNCGATVHLDCIGKIQRELRPFVAAQRNVQVFPPLPKSQLREVYWNHDVLVLPSLGDSFGFVALEAMACGLPVIVTENCGVPVPDPAWRVPIMDSTAIAQRLAFYEGDREALARDGGRAQLFARQFTPERYREQIAALFRRLLA